MSTSIASGDRKAAPIWSSTHGLAFAAPKNATWRPQHGVRFSSPNTTSPGPRMPPSDGLADSSLEVDRDNASLLVTAHEDFSEEIDIRPSQHRQCSEQSSPDSSSGGVLLDEPVYPLLDLFSTAQGDGTLDTDISRQFQGLAEEDILSSPDTEVEPFRTPLGFHIPNVRLKSAIEAVPPSPSAYWQHTLYRGPDGDKETVKVHYCKNKENTETIAQLFLDERVIGFDLEWKINPKDDSVKKNVALIQVASERRVALFHLARFPGALEEDDFISPSLRKLMESPEITKVGVNIKGDATRLRNFLHIECQGLLELSHLYKLVKHSTGDVKKINKALVSLANQVQEHLQLPLWKGEVRSSDWTQDLSYQQTQYAASDSYAGLLLFYVLESKRKMLEPMPPCPAHAELNIPIKLANGKPVPKVDEVTEIDDENSDESSDISIADLVGDFQATSVTDEDVSMPETTPLYPAIPSTKPDKPISLPPSLELSIANAWVEQYSLSRPTNRPATKPYARPAELRAYTLFQNQGLDVTTIAMLLRTPPLQPSTVVSYISKAIVTETLPYDRGRICELEPLAGAFDPYLKRLQGSVRRDGE